MKAAQSEQPIYADTTAAHDYSSQHNGTTELVVLDNSYSSHQMGGSRILGGGGGTQRRSESTIVKQRTSVNNNNGSQLGVRKDQMIYIPVNGMQQHRLSTHNASQHSNRSFKIAGINTQRGKLPQLYIDEGQVEQLKKHASRCSSQVNIEAETKALPQLEAQEDELKKCMVNNQDTEDEEDDDSYDDEDLSDPDEPRKPQLQSPTQSKVQNERNKLERAYKKIASPSHRSTVMALGVTEDGQEFIHKAHRDAHNQNGLANLIIPEQSSQPYYHNISKKHLKKKIADLKKQLGKRKTALKNIEAYGNMPIQGNFDIAMKQAALANSGSGTGPLTLAQLQKLLEDAAEHEEQQVYFNKRLKKKKKKQIEQGLQQMMQAAQGKNKKTNDAIQQAYQNQQLFNQMLSSGSLAAQSAALATATYQSSLKTYLGPLTNTGNQLALIPGNQAGSHSLKRNNQEQFRSAKKGGSEYKQSEAMMKIQPVLRPSPKNLNSQAFGEVIASKADKSAHNLLPYLSANTHNGGQLPDLNSRKNQSVGKYPSTNLNNFSSQPSMLTDQNAEYNNPFSQHHSLARSHVRRAAQNANQSQYATEDAILGGRNITTNQVIITTPKQHINQTFIKAGAVSPMSNQDQHYHSTFSSVGKNGFGHQTVHGGSIRKTAPIFKQVIEQQHSNMLKGANQNHRMMNQILKPLNHDPSILINNQRVDELKQNIRQPLGIGQRISNLNNQGSSKQQQFTSSKLVPKKSLTTLTNQETPSLRNMLNIIDGGSQQIGSFSGDKGTSLHIQVNESKLDEIKDVENEDDHQRRTSSIEPRKVEINREGLKSTMSPRASQGPAPPNIHMTPVQQIATRSKLISHTFSKTNMNFASTQRGSSITQSTFEQIPAATDLANPSPLKGLGSFAAGTTATHAYDKKHIQQVENVLYNKSQQIEGKKGQREIVRRQNSVLTQSD
ncbi:hypothetical protein FGO68_gene5772 [Halteria grandinella]|uniref:Uncharacterized protein n=1 Tax=Halteria grandinella TaxID=5974 RepID=A0A8J8T9M0_HALGN|nr:hypothetical protein FGO68_gene5772 [Halteria grandinella]